MLRKTLTILSLIGLLLSWGLWGVSYLNVGCEAPYITTNIPHELKTFRWAGYVA